MSHNLFNSLQSFEYAGRKGQYYSVPALEKAGLGKVSRLPRSSGAERAGYRLGAINEQRETKVSLPRQ